MPVVIDGYNLYHFARGIYLEDGVNLSIPAFCGIVEEWAGQARQKVLMVFDGSPPPAMRQNPKHYGGIALEYTGSEGDADSFIMNYISKNTAPKLLTVVSSDLQIRKAAGKRHCKVLKSDELWVKMARKLMRKKPKPEPRSKTTGIMSYEREYWLKIFGLKDE